MQHFSSSRILRHLAAHTPAGNLLQQTAVPASSLPRRGGVVFPCSSAASPKLLSARAKAGVNNVSIYLEMTVLLLIILMKAVNSTALRETSTEIP